MFYKKGVDISSPKSMFNFINGHYKYYTMNSWNGLKSIANNVKLYNLRLGRDYDKLYDELFTDYSEVIDVINLMIRDWEKEHPNYRVGFNGRSDGYLVLYNANNNGDVIPEYLDYDTYEDFKEYCKDYHECVKDYKYELRAYTRLIRDFDRLCDDLREYLISWLKENN